jgi:hypothetical protein
MAEVDEKTQALAALKLKANVSNLIREEVNQMLGEWQTIDTLLLRTTFMPQLVAACLNDPGFYDAVRTVILAVDHERSYAAKANTDALQGQVRP